MVRYGVAYQKKSAADYAEQHRQCLEQNLKRRAKEMGYELKKIEAVPEKCRYELVVGRWR